MVRILIAAVAHAERQEGLSPGDGNTFAAKRYNKVQDTQKGKIVRRKEIKVERLV